MFYWLNVTGGTALHKFTWDRGPWPKADALALKDRIVTRHPNLSAGVAPAWEAPFEDMVRAKADVYRFGKPSGHRWIFIYRATVDRLFVFTGNMRCGDTLYRTGDQWRIGHEINGGTEHSLRLRPEVLEEVERQLRLKAPDGCWDSGWSPASPEDR